MFPEDDKFQGLQSEERKNLDSRYVVESTEFLLKVLREKKTQLTFFIIAEMAEWYPELIEKIAAEGHEIAYHTHTHRFIHDRKILESELKRSRDFLDRYHPKGFQAPAIVFTQDGYKVLRDHGFTYSSSVYEETRNVKNIDGIVEIPVSVYRWRKGKGKSEWNYPMSMKFSQLKTDIPFGSSYFAAILGAKKMESLVRHFENQGEIVNLFIHNWQLVPSNEPKKDRIKQLAKNPLYYPYTRNILPLFESLLSNFKFTRFDHHVHANLSHYC